MSADPKLISGEGEDAVWVDQFTGPAESDGHHLMQVQILGSPSSGPMLTQRRGAFRLTARQAHGLADWLLSNGYGTAGRAHLAAAGRFVCPRCFKVSNNPQDVEHGYCGRCHEWTGDTQRS